MNYFQLGNSELKISCIGLGTWQFGDGWWGKGIKDEVFIDTLIQSHYAGVNFVDTAEAYGGGISERIMGKAIQMLNRDEIVVATKVDGNHLRYRDVIKACDGSLQRLGVKEIDLYQVHWPNPWDQVPLSETMSAMEMLYKRGKIRAIGVCNFAVRDLKEARGILSLTDIVSNQVRYNILQREIEDEVLPYCLKEGITILAYNPLAQGVLTGKYTSSNIPTDKARSVNKLFTELNLNRISKLMPVLQEIANSRNRSMAQVALSWLLTKPSVVPIPGARNSEQALQNAGAAGWRLTKNELSRIENALKSFDIDYF